MVVDVVDGGEGVLTSGTIEVDVGDAVAVSLDATLLSVLVLPELVLVGDRGTADDAGHPWVPVCRRRDRVW